MPLVFDAADIFHYLRCRHTMLIFDTPPGAAIITAAVTLR